MNDELLRKNLRVVKDFPIKGIGFFDITTLLQKPECLKEITDRMYELYKDKGITKVVGIESRGFILGAILAEKLGAGFVPARKKGKLPFETIKEEYKKEYGTDAIYMHKDALDGNDVVLLHDDLLATGGTMKAAVNLAKQLNPKRIYVNFVIEITNLEGRKAFSNDTEVTSILDVVE